MNQVSGLDRITFTPGVMQGQACIKGTRVAVSTIVDTIAAGRTSEEILKAYSNLEKEDIDQALHFAAMNVRREEYDLIPA